MKNKFALILIAVLVIAGIILVVKMNGAPTANENANASTTPAYDNSFGVTLNGQTSADAFALINDPEVEDVRTAVYQCKDKKSIEAILYLGGKDPRADIVLMDYEPSTDGSVNEARRLILAQKETPTGIRYATDNGSIVFASKGDQATIEENGKAIFSKCEFTTSAFVQ